MQRLVSPCLSSAKPMSKSTTPGSTGRSIFSQSLETTWRAAAGRAACKFAAAAAKAKLPPMAALLLMLVSCEELSAADWQWMEAPFWPLCCLACCCWGLAGWNTARGSQALTAGNASPLSIVDPSTAHRRGILCPGCCGSQCTACTLPMRQDMLMDSSAVECLACSTDPHLSPPPRSVWQAVTYLNVFCMQRIAQWC